MGQEKMEYGYRTSVLKREHPPVVHPFGRLASARRPASHPDQDGTIFRPAAQHPAARRQHGFDVQEPARRKAGKLIEAAGLKGRRIGNAEISPQHANFFINHGQTKASRYEGADRVGPKTVAEKFGINLELEVELIGEW